MEPVIVARLLHVSVMACCSNASALAGFEQYLWSVSCLVCQHLSMLDEDSKDMVACLWVGECAW